MAGFKRLLIILSIPYIAYSWWDDRPISHAPVNLIAERPLQETITHPGPFLHKEYTIIPLATFQAKARVLSKEKYYFDREADLAPVDLALGWGPMSNEAVLEKISIRQSNRFYFWRVDQFPIPREAIEISSANMHFIPSTPEIEKRLGKVKVGHLIEFSGKLVRVQANDGWRWVSSLSRDDTGVGACELVWVEEFYIS